MSFIVNRDLVFIDSMKFMNSSLNSLIKNLRDDDFKYLSIEFWDALQLKLVKQKRVYPYEYMDSLDKFDQTKLPSKKRFYIVL